MRGEYADSRIFLVNIVDLFLQAPLARLRILAWEAGKSYCFN